MDGREVKTLPLWEFQVVSAAALVGVAHALTFENCATIYLSPALFALIQDPDEAPTVLQGLSVLIMPVGGIGDWERPVNPPFAPSLS